MSKPLEKQRVLRIKEILQNKKMNTTQLAKLMGVSDASLSVMNSEKTWPKRDTLLKIASVLDVDVRDLFFPTKDEAPMNGFVQFNDKIYTIRDMKDLEILNNDVFSSYIKTK